MAEPCEPFDLTCKAKEWATSAVGDAIGSLADGVMEAFGHAIGGLGTIWVRIGTPNLTGGASVVPTGQPPGTAGIDTVLGYATWIGFGIAILGLIAAGVRLAVSRSGQTQQAVERIGVVLIAVILISASVAIVTGLLSGARTGSPTVSFLQNSLWYYTMAVAVLGVIVAGARMAWEQRAEPGRQLIQGLLTLVVVAGAGLSVVALLTTAADSFSVWILNNSLDCNIAGDGTCFGKSMFQLLALTAGTAGAGGFGAVLVIILGVVAVFAALAQIVLMIVRAGALVVLAGMLPVAAAASLSDPQRTMLRKTSAWLLGFILYKPAAAIVYATAFRLVGTDLFGDDGLVTVLTGLALMLLALVALPALMRLIVPAVTAVSSGSGGMAGMALAGAATALPTGAALTSRASGGGNGSSGSGGGSGPSGAGPSGASPAAGGGSSGGGGAAAGSGSAAGAAGSSGAAATGGAGSSGAAAGGAAASGAAAGSAAAAAVPPVAAASAAMNAAGAVGNAARSAAESSTGGPDGAV